MARQVVTIFELSLIVAGLVVGVPLTIYLKQRARRRYLSMLEETNEALGGKLTLSPENMTLAGHLGDCFVSIARIVKGDRRFTIVRVGEMWLGSPTFRLENTVSRLAKHVVGEDIQTGDPEFDNAVLLGGPDQAEILSRMDSDLRTQIMHGLVEGGLRLDDGPLRWQEKSPTGYLNRAPPSWLRK